MTSIKIVTVIESIYLIYMYFFFKTSYSFAGASFEKETESLGQMFVHDTGRYENKICVFGKIMAILAVILAVIRLYFLRSPDYKPALLKITIVFDMLCLSLASIMNLNALVYLLPIVAGEIYLFS